MRPAPVATSALMGALVLAATILVGCGDDGSSPGTTSASTGAASAPTTAAALAGGATPEGTSTTTADDLGGDGIGDLESLAPQLLLAAGELGIPSLTDVGYTPPTDPNPCGLDIDAEIPADALAGTRLADPGTGLEILQEIRVYADAATATAAFDATVGGATCETPGDGTEPTAPVDASEAIDGVDAAVTVAATSPTVARQTIVVRLVDSVVTFTFAAPPGAAESAGAPVPVDVAAYGIGKIIAQLESG